jgi:Fe-S-cluster containining protein
VTFDCQTCGACCVNPLENEAEGFRSWVEVGPKEPLLKRKDLVRKLVVLDEAGDPHLKLDSAGRCAALKGALGKRVTCGIYHLRPRGCRTVQAGDADCRRYRRERGITS